MLYLFKFVLSLIFVLVSVAFFTLLERKILGFIQIRLGPRKLFWGGVFQPFSDAIKLFSKDDLKFKELNINFFFFFSFFYVFLCLFFWRIISFWGILFFSLYSLILIICIIGFGVYFLLLIGWSRNTKFSLLGSYRSSAQSISYEVVIILSILFLFYFWFSFNFLDIYFLNIRVRFLFLFLILFFLWFISCVAECNRSPFDFSEGESELVSGFNTEYLGGLFSLIFIGEYRSIIVFSFLTCIFFFSFFYCFFFFVFIAYFFLWFRGSYPRLRYDFLIIIAWKSLSVVVLSYFFLFICFS